MRPIVEQLPWRLFRLLVIINIIIIVFNQIHSVSVHDFRRSFYFCLGFFMSCLPTYCAVSNIRRVRIARARQRFIKYVPKKITQNIKLQIYIYATDLKHDKIHCHKIVARKTQANINCVVISITTRNNEPWSKDFHTAFAALHSIRVKSFSFLACAFPLSGRVLAKLFVFSIEIVSFTHSFSWARLNPITMAESDKLALQNIAMAALSLLLVA